MNIRQQIKSTPYGSLIWRIFVGVVGGLITIVGTVFLFAPGPGLLVLLAGLGILALEACGHGARSGTKCGVFKCFCGDLLS